LKNEGASSQLTNELELEESALEEAEGGMGDLFDNDEIEMPVAACSKASISIASEEKKAEAWQDEDADMGFGLFGDDDDDGVAMFQPLCMLRPISISNEKKEAEICESDEGDDMGFSLLDDGFVPQSTMSFKKSEKPMLPTKAYSERSPPRQASPRSSIEEEKRHIADYLTCFDGSRERTSMGKNF
jgi:hypothetical protein